MGCSGGIGLKRLLCLCARLLYTVRNIDVKHAVAATVDSLPVQNKILFETLQYKKLSDYSSYAIV